MRKIGFTIIELLVVIAIFLVLIGILFPVFEKAKIAAKVTGSVSNLRQQHLLFKMYQSDNGGEGIYSSWDQMGYPPPETDWPRLLDKSLRLWSSPCGCHPSWPCPVTITYIYHWPPEGSQFADAYQEDLILYSDQHCNSTDLSLYNNFQERRGLGVLLSGQIKNLRKRGNLKKFSWWAEPRYFIEE